MIKAIETRYKGYRFRSRLEARWAVFFDSLGIVWEYEAEGYILPNGTGCYLPDFKLLPAGKREDYNEVCFVEIKGGCPIDIEIKKIRELCNDYGWQATGYIFYGTPGLNAPIQIGGCSDDDTDPLTWFAWMWSKASGELSPVGDVDDDPDLVQMEARFKALAERATVAARSARFEFGESGAPQ